MSQTYSVDIVAKVLGGQKVDKLAKGLKGVDVESKKVARGSNKAANSIRKLGLSSNTASRKVSGLASSVRNLAAGFALLQIGKSIVTVGVDSVESARRLRALAGAFGEVQEVELAAARAAEKFGLSQREASKSFAQIYARLRPIGIELEQIESAFNGFNTAARLSGTSAQEASAAWLQLSQALGSGVLRGEELNSVFEQTPTVVQAIAEEMNAPIGQIRQLAKDGQITSDVVLRALNRLERDGVDQLAEALNGPRQKFKDFSNSVETLSNALATTVLPELTSAISEVGETILLLEGPIKYISGLLSTALGEINSLIRQITKTASMSARLDIEAGKDPASLITTFTKLDPYAGAKKLFGEEGFKELKEQAQEFSKLRNQNVKEVFVDLAQDRLQAMEGDSYIKQGVKALLPPTSVNKTSGGGGGGGGGGRSTASRAAREEARAAKDQARLVERQSEAYESIRQSLTRTILLNSDLTAEGLKNSDLQRQRLENSFELEDAVKRINKEVAAGNQAELIALAELKKEQADLTALRKSASDFAGFFAEAKAIDEELNSELTKTEELATSIGGQLSNGITDALIGAVNGTKDLGEAFQELASDILAAVGKALILQAITGAVGAVGSGGTAGSGLLGGSIPRPCKRWPSHWWFSLHRRRERTRAFPPWREWEYQQQRPIRGRPRCLK